MNAQELFDAFRDADPAWLNEADQLADRAAARASHSEIQEEPENEIQQIFAQYSGSASGEARRSRTEIPAEPGEDIFADLTGSVSGLPVQQPAERPAERSSRLFYRIGGIAAAIAVFTVGAFAVSVITAREDGGMSTIPAAQPSASETQSDPADIYEVQTDAVTDDSYNLMIHGEDHYGEIITYSTEVDDNGSITYHFKLDGQTFDLNSGEDFQLYSNESGTSVQVYNYLLVPQIDVSLMENSLYSGNNRTRQFTFTIPEQTPLELTLKPIVCPGELYSRMQIALRKAIDAGDDELLSSLMEQTNYRTERSNAVPAVITPTEAGCNYSVLIYQDGKLLDITDPETGEASTTYQYALKECASDNTKTISITPFSTNGRKSGSRIDICIISKLPDGTYYGETPYEFRLKTTDPGTAPSISGTYLEDDSE